MDLQVRRSIVVAVTCAIDVDSVLSDPCAGWLARCPTAEWLTMKVGSRWMRLVETGCVCSRAATDVDVHRTKATDVDVHRTKATDADVHRTDPFPQREPLPCWN